MHQYKSVKRAAIKPASVLMSGLTLCLPDRYIINDRIWSSPRTCTGHISYTAISIYVDNKDYTKRGLALIEQQR